MKSTNSPNGKTRAIGILFEFCVCMHFEYKYGIHVFGNFAQYKCSTFYAVEKREQLNRSNMK